MSLLFGRRRPEERLISSASVWGTTASGDPIAAWLTDGRAPGEDPLRLAPVWASVRLIADGVASLPMAAVREDADGRKVRLPEQPGLVTAPTRFGTAYDWRFRLMSSLLLHGNAVGLLVEGYRGWPAQVEWLRPDLLDCDEDDKAHPIYYDGRKLDESSFVHVASFVKPGYRWGLSPIGAYRSVLDVGLAAQDYAREWFTEGAPIPKGILRNVEQPVVRDVARSVKESYKRTMKHGDVFVTGKDWEWTSTTLPADDARFIETMKATATQVAAIYGVPPEMIGGETGSSLTYSTVEQNLLNFATLTLRPWVTRLEESLSTLLPRGQRIRFNLDAMVRSDTKTKYEVMKIQKEINLRSVNELRALDDLPPVDGGDEVIPPKPEPVAPQQVPPTGSSPDARHLPGQHNQKDHAGGRGGLPDVPDKSADGKYPEDAVSAARATRAAAAAAEPEITSLVTGLAGRHSGQMLGLQYRLKTEESLARKVDGERGEHSGDAAATAASMSDVVRYTMQLSDSDYTAGANGTLNDLRDAGCQLRIKNYWEPGDPYQGINVAVTHPSGVTFELQFHTPSSFQAKNVGDIPPGAPSLHAIYERTRTSGDSRTLWEGYSQSVRIASHIPVPAGVYDIGTTKFQPFRDAAGNVREVRAAVRGNVRWYAKIDPAERLLATYRLTVDDTAQTLDQHVWDGTGWVPVDNNDLLLGRLLLGDPLLVEIPDPGLGG